MASEYLALPEDIDDQIRSFVAGMPGVTTETVVRDITRIGTIAKLVKCGWLDGKRAVLCGGMAMRCLHSPRFTVYDTDTSGTAQPDYAVLAEAIAIDDDDLSVIPAAPTEWEEGKELVTARPIDYEPRFTRLDAGSTRFTLSVAWRGLERPASWETMKLGYPFDVLAEPDLRIPIMNPNEMLAEKLCAWWIHGHSKHYYDIAFLGQRLAGQESPLGAESRDDILELVAVKLKGNRKVAGWIRERVDALTTPRKISLLRNPEGHVQAGREFGTLSYLFGEPPELDQLKKQVARTIIRPLFESAR